MPVTLRSWVNRDGQGWKPDDMKSVSSASFYPDSISFDSMKGLMRNLGVGIGYNGNEVSFNLFVLPAIPWYKIDNR